MGTSRFAPCTKHAAEVPHGGGGFGLRSHHEAWRVAQREHREPECIAQLEKPGGLVRSGSVDRAAEVARVVGDDTDRPALNADQRGDDPLAESGPELQHRSGVGERLDNRSNVVDAEPVLRKYDRYRFAAATAASSSATALSTSTNRVCVVPASTSSCASSARRNPMLVGTPSMRKSPSARAALAIAAETSPAELWTNLHDSRSTRTTCPSGLPFPRAVLSQTAATH